MPVRFVLILFLNCLLLTANAQIDTIQKIIPGRVNSPAQRSKPYVILISADGFRYDYVQKHQATNLMRLSKQGVVATSMIPSFPSVTFPNHYTLATGLYPSHHGLVDNSFYDSGKKLVYSMSDRAKVKDKEWYGGIPLWVLAERQEMVTASFYWVGTEAPVKNIFPTYSYAFTEAIPLRRRLAIVKEWLELPEATRPHLITFYFPEVDHQGHMFGPDAEETRQAVQLIDKSVAELVALTRPLNLPLNFIFVSDHGMTRVDTVNTLTLPAIVRDTAACKAVSSATTVHLYLKKKINLDSVIIKLKTEAKGYDSYLLKDTPKRWHYRPGDDWFNRIGDIILVPHYPLVFKTGKGVVTPGKHGFDPVNPDMHSTFLAWGPQFKNGMTIPSFENVNVYPLVAKILGLNFEHSMDGKIEVLQSILKK
jgi:predicted AlkP superfamily pyrophosphatase or phosphodiesterase